MHAIVSVMYCQHYHRVCWAHASMASKHFARRTYLSYKRLASVICVMLQKSMSHLCICEDKSVCIKVLPYGSAKRRVLKVKALYECKCVKVPPQR